MSFPKVKPFSVIPGYHMLLGILPCSIMFIDIERSNIMLYPGKDYDLV